MCKLSLERDLVWIEDSKVTSLEGWTYKVELKEWVFLAELGSYSVL